MLSPLHDRVVIQPLEPLSVTPGGILLPDTAKEKPAKVGDVVLYGSYAGHDVTHDGKDFLIVNESEILAVIS